MTADTAMMVMFLRAILIVRGIGRRFVVVMMARILGVMHCRQNLARVFAKDWRLEAEKDSKQQYPIENVSQHERDGYHWIERRQAYLKGIFKPSKILGLGILLAIGAGAG